MAAASPQNKAIIKQGAGKPVVTHTVIPTLRDEFMIVKTVAVALNPADWQSVDQEGNEGTISGFDYSGVVVEVGKKVKKFKKGDRVAGCSLGANTSFFQGGGFAEYTLVKGDIQLHIPDNIGFEEAAAWGVAIGTNALALYNICKIPFPTAGMVDNGTSILIYGGSTNTGTMAIQMAKLSGFTVVVTCSSHNFEMVKSYGADAVFDYHDADCGNQIREYTKDSLALAWDTIAEPGSLKICEEAISSKGGFYCSIEPIEVTRSDLKAEWVLGYLLFGEKFIMRDIEWPARTDLLEWYKDIFGPMVQSLVDAGKLKAHPISVQEGGLHGVLDGLKELREWKVSGQKLVYRIEDTK